MMIMIIMMMMIMMIPDRVWRENNAKTLTRVRINQL